jgi:hypothetical protein
MASFIAEIIVADVVPGRKLQPGSPGRPGAGTRMTGTASLVTRPRSVVTSSMMANAAWMRSGAPITMVTAGT